jgi:2-phosphosulfolactate phosphatase
MIQVLYSWAELPFMVREIGETKIRRSIWIVIDVLRATSTIVAAFEAGCLAIVPASGIAEARSLRRVSKRRDRLLVGERNGRPIKGFDLGNSPREFISGRVSGRELVQTTSNGTRAINAVSVLEARDIWMASFGNAHAIGRRAAKEQKNGRGKSVHILCSGKQGRFCLEDAVCAGMIIERMKVRKSELTDSASACWNLYQQHQLDLRRMLRKSDWGRYLINIGLGLDLEFCARTNWSGIVPVLSKGIIKPG